VWLTENLLLNYQRCQRRAFLDVHGDPEQREPPSDYLLKLIQDGQAYHTTVLAEAPYERPVYPQGDWSTGAAATRELMAQGVERIYQGVLLAPATPDWILVSQPDLLIRQPEPSCFGDWSYAPVEIKLAKRTKPEYKVIVAFHTQVLAQVQGVWSSMAWLMLRGRGSYPVPLEHWVPQMQTTLAECSRLLQAHQEPEVFIARSRCSLCHWLGHCYGIAQDQQHLSLLPGVTPRRYQALKGLRLNTLETLAHATLENLEDSPELNNGIAPQLIRQARANYHHQPFWSYEVQPLPTPAPLPTAGVELYFDIESEPELDMAYLHGVLVVDHHTETQTFAGFLAQCPQDEAQVWQQFLSLTQKYPTAPIFHFCPYEAQTMILLAQRYQTPPEQIQTLLHRFWDVHAWITHHLTLPVESYTLKAIARWLGFTWRDAEANGAQSICWYNQWLSTGDRHFLETILRYNEDDCRATYHVKTWLGQFMAAGD